MKKTITALIFILLISGFIYYILSYTCSGFSGKLNIENSIKKCIMHYGLVNLDNVTVRENTFVSGKLFGSNVSLNNININGDLFLSDSSIVNGKVIINGLLITSSSKFEKPIYITTSKIELNEGSITKDIYIQKHPFNIREEFIYIDNSTVNGNITFEGNLGRVILVNGSIITGKVIGGEIITN